MQRNWPIASQLLALFVIFLLSWGIASSLFPGVVNANSTVMRIIFLIIGAQACGILVSFVGLPGEKKDYQILAIKSKLGDIPSGFPEFLICYLKFSHISFPLDMLGMIGFGGES